VAKFFYLNVMAPSSWKFQKGKNAVEVATKDDKVAIATITEVVTPVTPQQQRIRQLKQQLDQAKVAQKRAKLNQQQIKLNQQRAALIK
jgi:hypothetical protein